MTLPPGFFDKPFAHRALHGQGAPENSAEAILAAVEAGYGIEIDVQLSQDGAAMVFHDYGLERLTGQPGTVQTISAAELSSLPLLGGETGAPTLREALTIVSGRVPLVIEIKDQDGAMGPNVGRLARAVAEALKAYDGLVAVMSFNPHAVAAMADLAPNIPRGLTTCDFSQADWPVLKAARRKELAQIRDFDRVGASFISHDSRALRDAPVAALKAKGTAILTWTIKSQAEAHAALEVADQITFEGYTPA
ncbi:MAG: glycerophosphodiester phosphodiesterase family protein [Pseudomonadota bacterium]